MARIILWTIVIVFASAQAGQFIDSFMESTGATEWANEDVQ